MISIRYPLAGCAAAAALGVLAAAGMARAQPPGPAPGASAQGAQMQRLHDALNLNPRQEQAWQAYLVGLRTPPEQAQRMRAISQMSLAAMSTPQRLDMIGEGLGLQQEAFHRTADATRAFYAVLSPPQQQTFDQITAPPSRKGPGG